MEKTNQWYRVKPLHHGVCASFGADGVLMGAEYCGNRSPRQTLAYDSANKKLVTLAATWSGAFA